MPSIKSDSGPDYKFTGAQEIDENPLLAHLQLPPETDNEAFLRLGLRPEFDSKERDLPAAIRRLRINRLRRFFAPTIPTYRRALIEISSQVFDGYVTRNPLTARGQGILYGGSADQSYRPTISLIAGHSGMGKSTLLDRILANVGKQLCQHRAFRGVHFPELQILWLRRNVPEHCTVGTLCSTFGDYTDHVLGQSLYGGIFSKLKGGDRNLYLSAIRKIITNHHVGLLVLDEFQNLSLMGVGAKKIIAFLVNLRDELGLPIVVAGTYKALRLLERELSTARRLVEGGYFDIDRPTAVDESWYELCEIAWRYQWVRKPTEFSSAICEALYEVSQGITGIMLSVYAGTQLAAIENGSEKIDASLILKVFNDRMTPLHQAIRILKSGTPLLLDKFDDLYKNLYPSEESPAGEVTTRNPNPEPSNGAEAVDNISASETSIRKKQPTKKRDKCSLRPLKEKPVLSEEQIKKLVTCDSIVDLISVLDKA